jgi:hypothetical protein
MWHMIFQIRIEPGSSRVPVSVSPVRRPRFRPDLRQFFRRELRAETSPWPVDGSRCCLHLPTEVGAARGMHLTRLPRHERGGVARAPERTGENRVAHLRGTLARDGCGTRGTSTDTDLPSPRRWPGFAIAQRRMCDTPGRALRDVRNPQPWTIIIGKADRGAARRVRGSGGARPRMRGRARAPRSGRGQPVVAGPLAPGWSKQSRSVSALLPGPTQTTRPRSGQCSDAFAGTPPPASKAETSARSARRGWRKLPGLYATRAARASEPSSRPSHPRAARVAPP